MKNFECVVSRVNLGDYQGTDFFVSMKAELEPGEKLADVSRKLRSAVDRALVVDIGAHFKARNTPISVEQICKRYGFSTKEIAP